MQSLFETLKETGKFEMEVNKYGTIAAANLQPKKGVTLDEIGKILPKILANANKILLDKGVADITSSLLEDPEVKAAIKKQAAKTVQLFIGPRFLIVVGRDENGKWIDNDQAVAWDKIHGPITRKEQGTKFHRRQKPQTS